MSRYSAYTHWFVLMNKREQEAWTKAFVWLAIKPYLTMSERRTLTEFERVWFAGKDFTADRTYDWFLAACQRHRVTIQFMRKPPEVGRRGERGAMGEVEWTKPEVDGSYWPASKDGKGRKREVDEIIRMKELYRTKVKLLEMARMGIGELTFRHDQIDVMVERRLLPKPLKR